MNPLLIRRRGMMSEEMPQFFTYLHFDGQAYIQTDIIVPTDYTYTVRVRESRKAYMAYFSEAGDNSSKVGVYLNSNTNNSHRAFNAYYLASGALVSGTQKTLTWSGAGAYGLFLTPKRLGTGTTSVAFTRGNNSPSGCLVIGQDYNYSDHSYQGTMGVFHIYGTDAQNETTFNNIRNNHTPVYSFRPCIYRGESGLWCVQLSKFYGNSAGIGTLTANDVDN